jgi:F0F1-type ATP synthase assembly protein I
MKRQRLTQARRLTVVNAVLLLVVLMVIVQLWLLTASVNAYLGGDTSVTLPAALASLVCLGFNLGLLRQLYRFE